MHINIQHHYSGSLASTWSIHACDVSECPLTQEMCAQMHMHVE